MSRYQRPGLGSGGMRVSWELLFLAISSASFFNKRRKSPFQVTNASPPHPLTFTPWIFFP